MLRHLFVVVALASFACGVSETNSSSSQTCRTQHECVNGACKCTQGPKTGSSCCDPRNVGCGSSACDTFCRFCE